MIMIWIVVILAAAYVLYGFLAKSPYVREFPTGFPADEDIDGYLKPREHVDPDEESMTRRIAGALAADTKRLKRHAGVGNPSFQEPHWGHTTGMLQGDLVIDEANSLPEQFRVGLFSKESRFPAVARVGFTKDPDLRFAINRIAVKLSYPLSLPNSYSATQEAQELDLLFVEGDKDANSSGRQFFARDARQLDMATTLKPPSIKTLKTLANWRNIGIFLRVLKNVSRLMKPLRKAPSVNSGWAGKPYFSSGPYALGEGAMKFCLRPNQKHDLPKSDSGDDNPFVLHEAAMGEWLNLGENASFDLCVQIATPECIPEPGPDDPPKSVMAAEYCDMLWDENSSPYVKVGTLTLYADEAFNREHPGYMLQFNAWNTLPEMRPLGQLFRVRKQAHAAHSSTRLSHIYDQTPGAMVGKCPFPH